MGRSGSGGITPPGACRAPLPPATVLGQRLPGDAAWRGRSAVELQLKRWMQGRGASGGGSAAAAGTAAAPAARPASRPTDAGAGSAAAAGLQRVALPNGSTVFIAGAAPPAPGAAPGRQPPPHQPASAAAVAAAAATAQQQLPAPPPAEGAPRPASACGQAAPPGSGLVTPGLLSPSGLFSPPGGSGAAAAAAAAGCGGIGLESLEALLADVSMAGFGTPGEVVRRLLRVMALQAHSTHCAHSAALATGGSRTWPCSGLPACCLQTRATPCTCSITTASPACWPVPPACWPARCRRPSAASCRRPAGGQNQQAAAAARALRRSCMPCFKPSKRVAPARGRLAVALLLLLATAAAFDGLQRQARLALAARLTRAPT